MAPVFRFATLLMACSVMVVATAQGTVKPADIDAVQLVTKPPAATLIPEASVDSPTFRKVPNGICSDKVAQRIQTIYSKNRPLFDVCAQTSKYQIFPFSGKLPTQEQIYAMATTKACTALFTACVLADLPQCDISELGLKSAVETLLKVTVDIDHGKPTPDTMQFHYLHIWRRDSNLAQAAGVPFGNDSAIYREYSTNLWTALTKYNVHVLPDLSIEYSAADLATAMHGGADGGPMAAQTLSNHSSAGSSDGALLGTNHKQNEDEMEIQLPTANASTPSPVPSPTSGTHRISRVAALSTALATVVVGLMCAAV